MSPERARIEADIAALREKFGVSTDAQLAARLGCAPSSISNWKKRLSIPARFLRFLFADGAFAPRATADGPEASSASQAARDWLVTVPARDRGVIVERWNSVLLSIENGHVVGREPNGAVLFLIAPGYWIAATRADAVISGRVEAA